MITAREIMTVDADYIDTNETVGAAAIKMRDLDVGSLPVCRDGRELAGVLTQRDIVVKCIACGVDPYTARARDYAEDEPVTIDADDSIETAIVTMAIHQVRRLPVLDGQDLVGVLSQSDVAESLS